jgi:hypothetical protein
MNQSRCSEQAYTCLIAAEFGHMSDSNWCAGLF